MTVRAASSTPEPRSPRVLWLIPAALALHNVEEAITFPRYLPIVRARLPDVVRPIAALAVNGPLSIQLFRRARHERWIAPWSWWLMPPAAFLLHGPGLIGLLLLT